ncbi:ribosome small subunit-dependent GTPase A [Paraburkholderia aspalathi]|nr:ribosome small subunit-dependent GTPase A [Paraburkholderia aspalathi]
MVHPLNGHSGYLGQFGWHSFFEDQLAGTEAELLRLRIDAIHRGRLTGLSGAEQFEIDLPARTDTAEYAVGDWVLADPLTMLLHRRLDRRTLLQRLGEGKRPSQLVAANVDTLFIVASCNSDFNLARLERYLAFANDAGTNPVIVLTKADLVEDAQYFEKQAAELQRGLAVVPLNARSADAAAVLQPWCGEGTTIAIVGSSGVGKSTLVNSLVGTQTGQIQQTGRVREGDSKGRHTTTARSLHAMAGGGWVIDTPGIRSLHMKDLGQGLDMLFAEITELAPDCKFRNCSHDHEPGCAVLAAVAAGTLDRERLMRWRKLQAESRG